MFLSESGHGEGLVRPAFTVRPEDSIHVVSVRSVRDIATGSDWTRYHVVIVRDDEGNEALHLVPEAHGWSAMVVLRAVHDALGMRPAATLAVRH